MKKQAITGAVLVVLAVGATQAMAGGDGKSRFMRHFDSNNDGIVNKPEFEQAAAARFKRMDGDGNGTLTRDEFREYVHARKEERKQEHYARMDTDGNGTVSRDEFMTFKQARAERKFARMDKNGDGSVSKEEFASCKKGKHRKGMFKRMDIDGNGEVTQNESLEAWSNWFKRIDANKDQVITTDEVNTYHNRIHGKQGSK